MEIPASLRRWFVVHFAVDMVFAVPLLVAPGTVLGWLGWPCVDGATARLVGAALVGIGGQSLLGRREGADVFRAMLNLKLLWSAAAIVGLFVAIADGAPPFTWAAFSMFIAFFGVWFYYRLRIKQISAAADHPPFEDEGGA
jgi:hypothetical protein